MVNSLSRKDDKTTLVADLSCSLLIVSQALFGLIGISNISLFFSIALVIFIFLNIKKFKIHFGYVFLVLTIIICFLLSIILHGANSYVLGYFERFLLFGAVGGLCFSQQLKISRIFRIVCFLSIVIIPFSFYRITLVDVYTKSDSYMSWSYSLFPLFCIAFLSFKYRYINRVLALVIIVSLSFFFLRYGTRGIYLSIALFLFGFLIISIQKSRSIKITLLMAIFLLLIFIVYFHLAEMLGLLSNALNSFGIDSWALEKMALKISNSQIDSGRDIIYASAFEGILNNPFGHLISSFELQFSMHAHNVFVQVMYEFGIIGLFACIALLFFGLKASSNRKHGFQLSFTLLICSFGVLIVSSSYWDNPFFWFLISYVFFAKKPQKLRHNNVFVRKQRSLLNGILS